MRLNSLRLDDFGCFRGTRLEEIAADLVVIGGPQRAGKTTFMQALRQFRGGVGQGSEIPPATEEHRIDAEITHNGHQYRYLLNGHAAPSISPIDDGPDLGIDDVFGPVTERQYQQLYTISLDELRRLPPGIDDAEDLAQVLLGGAYGNIAEIPDVQETFRKQAYDIGLKRGDPSAKTTKLNQPHSLIQEGMQARTEANSQVDEYNTVTQELQEARADKHDVETTLEAKRQERNRLSILAELLEPIQRIDELDALLADADIPEAHDFPAHQTDRLDHFKSQLDDAVETLGEAEDAFDHETTLGGDGYREWLLTHEDEIQELDDNRRLWSDQIETLSEQESALADERQKLETTISRLHADWDGSFSHIKEIETNSVDTARTRELVSTLSDLQDKQTDLKQELETARSRRDDLEQQLSELSEETETETEVSLPKTKPLVIAASAVGAGTVAGFVSSPIVGGVVGLAIVGIGIFALDSTMTVESTVDAEPRRELKANIASAESDIEAAQEQLSQVESQFDEKATALTELVEDLGLPEEIPTAEVASFYTQAVDLNQAITEYEQDRAQWMSNRDALAEELAIAASLLDEVTAIQWTEESPLEDASSLLSTVESAATDLQLAMDVQTAKRDRASVVDDIDGVLTSWDEEKSIDESVSDELLYSLIEVFREQAATAKQIKEAADEREQLQSQVESRLQSPSAEEAFEPVRDDAVSLVAVATQEVAEYADEEMINAEIRDLQTETEELEQERDELHDQCLALESRQKELASEEDLREAQAKIDEGRVEFERLGEAYAVNRIAETMVGQLHERLMQDVVHSLVDDASDIFSNITQEYDGIELSGELQDLEFRALRSGGTDHGVGQLSRATAEQLFLAIRLARIRQTDVELPVVLDDAATNFDPDHISRVFDVVGELAATNQVFFLTCHPEFVNLSAATGSPAQYWSLEEGKFERQETAELLERQLMAD